MEQQVQLEVNGQELTQNDVNLLGKTAALADDRLLADLLRILPYNPTGPVITKAIMPYGGPLLSGGAGTVYPNGATGSVVVRNFRAVVGSRVAVGADKLEHWRGIESVVCALTDNTGDFKVTFAANPSGFLRYDLVYVAVQVDAADTTLTQYVKDPVSLAISQQTRITALKAKATIGVVTGTPGAGTPPLPVLPSDGSGIYYIPLAYVAIVNGFNSSTTINWYNISLNGPIGHLSRTTGASTVVVANQSSKLDGTVGSNLNAVSSGNFGRNTRRAMLSQEWVGSECLWLMLDLVDPSSAAWSHQSGQIIDDSRDWRNRIFMTMASATDVDPLVAMAPWDSIPQIHMQPSADQFLFPSFGQSFRDDNLTVAGNGSVCLLHGGVIPGGFEVGTHVGIYVDHSTGAMKVWVDGVPKSLLFLKIEASAPMPGW